MAENAVDSGPPEIELATIEDFIAAADLQRLFDYWCDKRRGRGMPAMGDIDPIDIGWALSRIFLMDYEPEDGFRYRLAGGEVSKVYKRGNLKGLNLKDILQPERAEEVEQRWLPLVQEPSAICMRGPIYFASGRSALGERLLLPLAEQAEGPVTGVLGMTVCDQFAGEFPNELALARCRYLPVADIP